LGEDLSKLPGFASADEMLTNAPCEQRVTLGGQAYLLRVETFLAELPRKTGARYLVDGLNLGRDVVDRFLKSPNREA
jgi:hypothetical protein